MVGFPFSLQKSSKEGGVLKYIAYHEVSIISLSFWLSWYLDMVSEAYVPTISDLIHPSFRSVIFGARYKEIICCIRAFV